MRNADRPAEEAASARGEVLRDEERPSYRFYLQHRAGMDAGAVTSWPAVRSLYWLMRQRATNPRAFGTEMQGEPRSEEDKVFHPQFWVMRSTHWIPFGACDPSMGKGETSDPSAIATFDASNRYLGHAAIYVSQNAGGLQVWDQWVGHPVAPRNVSFRGGKGNSVNDGDQYYVIE